MRSSVQGLPNEVDRESGVDVQAARRAPPARTYHSSMEVLEPEEWQARAEAHRRRVEAWAAPHLARRARGESHPIEDFLFTYYGHRPARLRQWHPGAGVALAGRATSAATPRHPEGVTLDTAALMGRRRPAVEWIARLLAATAAGRRGSGLLRPARVGDGLPAAAEIRHDAWPLRLGAEGIDGGRGAARRAVHAISTRSASSPPRRARSTCCSRPGSTQEELEQPGCLHANMDLYKWAYKLSPLVSGELVADCFTLARDIRAVDMRASPYDLSALGHRAIRIETPEGRAEYAADAAGVRRAGTASSGNACSTSANGCSPPPDPG